MSKIEQFEEVRHCDVHELFKINMLKKALVYVSKQRQIIEEEKKILQREYCELVKIVTQLQEENATYQAKLLNAESKINEECKVSYRKTREEFKHIEAYSSNFNRERENASLKQSIRDQKKEFTHDKIRKTNIILGPEKGCTLIQKTEDSLQVKLNSEDIERLISENEQLHMRMFALQTELEELKKAYKVSVEKNASAIHEEENRMNTEKLHLNELQKDNIKLSDCCTKQQALIKVIRYLFTNHIISINSMCCTKCKLPRMKLLKTEITHKDCNTLFNEESKFVQATWAKYVKLCILCLSSITILLNTLEEIYKRSTFNISTKYVMSICDRLKIIASQNDLYKKNILHLTYAITSRISNVIVQSDTTSGEINCVDATKDYQQKREITETIYTLDVVFESCTELCEKIEQWLRLLRLHIPFIVKTLIEVTSCQECENSSRSNVTKTNTAITKQYCTNEIVEYVKCFVDGNSNGDNDSDNNEKVENRELVVSLTEIVNELIELIQSISFMSEQLFVMHKSNANLSECETNHNSYFDDVTKHYMIKWLMLWYFIGESSRFSEKLLRSIKCATKRLEELCELSHEPKLSISLKCIASCLYSLLVNEEHVTEKDILLSLSPSKEDKKRCSSLFVMPKAGSTDSIIRKMFPFCIDNLKQSHEMLFSKWCDSNAMEFFKHNIKLSREVITHVNNYNESTLILEEEKRYTESLVRDFEQSKQALEEQIIILSENIVAVDSAMSGTAYEIKSTTLN